MSFKTNADLPDSVKDALPSDAQSVFKDAVNSQLEVGLSDERSFAKAWGEVQDHGWEKGDDDKWVKKVIKKQDETFSITGTITKLNEEQRLVFGWASIIDDENGTPIIDSQGDVIKSSELEKMAYDFVLNVRKASNMHDKSTIGIGDLVEAVVMTTEKQLAMGISKENLLPQGMWVGFNIIPEVFAKIKSGELSDFSIGGKAKRTIVEGVY